jgi:hypothetical protein
MASTVPLDHQGRLLSGPFQAPFNGIHFHDGDDDDDDDDNMHCEV